MYNDLKMVLIEIYDQERLFALIIALTERKSIDYDVTNRIFAYVITRQWGRSAKAVVSQKDESARAVINQ